MTDVCADTQTCPDARTRVHRAQAKVRARASAREACALEFTGTRGILLLFQFFTKMNCYVVWIKNEVFGSVSLQNVCLPNKVLARVGSILPAVVISTRGGLFYNYLLSAYYGSGTLLDSREVFKKCIPLCGVYRPMEFMASSPFREFHGLIQHTQRQGRDRDQLQPPLPGHRERRRCRWLRL